MESPERTKRGFDLTEEQFCFVISPIGKEGDAVYEKFKNVLDYVIKPAAKNSGYKLNVVRADDVDRAGSFIKDILELLLNSFVVIADLTDQNPNVFYELGVRHALSARTILIAQDISFIPSDLREYRTIIYEDSARGTALFQEKLGRYLNDIYEQPDRHDNPVLDRLGSVLEHRNTAHEKEVRKLKEQLNRRKDKEIGAPASGSHEHVITRTKRIIKVIDLDRPFSGEVVFDDKKKKELTIELPIDEGKFELFFLLSEDRNSISEYWYLGREDQNVQVARLLADVRVLLGLVPRIFAHDDVALFRFVIATNDDLSKTRKEIEQKFQKMKEIAAVPNTERVNLEIWDQEGLAVKEKELGIFP
jgi:hypothetical protein